MTRRRPANKTGTKPTKGNEPMTKAIETTLATLVAFAVLAGVLVAVAPIA
jgi:hypothetical protein